MNILRLLQSIIMPVPKDSVAQDCAALERMTGLKWDWCRRTQGGSDPHPVICYASNLSNLETVEPIAHLMTEKVAGQSQYSAVFQAAGYAVAIIDDKFRYLKLADRQVDIKADIQAILNPPAM